MSFKWPLNGMSVETRMFGHNDECEGNFRGANDAYRVSSHRLIRLINLHVARILHESSKRLMLST